jgi:tetratricopeptide (TPR) repeat protein
MFTNFWLSVTSFLVVTLAILPHQWQQITPTGDPDRDRSRLKLLQTENPCFVRGTARARLGELCLQQSAGAVAEGDFAEAAEPLQYLLNEDTGYEQEARRRLHRLPQQYFDYAEKLLQQGEATEARQFFIQMASLYPKVDQRLLARANIEAARCWREEIERHIKDRHYDEALNAIQELTAAAVPRSFKEEADVRVPELTTRAVREQLSMGQIKRTFETIRKSRAIVQERPDLAARLDTLRDWVGQQLFGEPIGNAPSALPVPVWSGPASANAPSKATLKVRNDSRYPLRLVLSSGLEAKRRFMLLVQPHRTGKLELPPGDYWQKAASPAAPHIRAYFGDLTLDQATYQQTFVVIAIP